MVFLIGLALIIACIWKHRSLLYILRGRSCPVHIDHFVSIYLGQNLQCLPSLQRNIILVVFTSLLSKPHTRHSSLISSKQPRICIHKLCLQKPSNRFHKSNRYPQTTYASILINLGILTLYIKLNQQTQTGFDRKVSRSALQQLCSLNCQVLFNFWHFLNDAETNCPTSPQQSYIVKCQSIYLTKST